MAPLKSKDIPVPFRRFLDVADGECYVINSFELHEQRQFLTRCLQRLAGPYDSVGADWPIETFKGDFSQIFE
jgi:hypothetical protein